MNRTTDLAPLQLRAAGFTWGELIEIHHVGPYHLVEFHPWLTEGATVLTGRPNRAVRQFGGYIDGKSLNEGWGTLDEALAGLIARRRGDRHADAYFIRMIASGL